MSLTQIILGSIFSVFSSLAAWPLLAKMQKMQDERLRKAGEGQAGAIVIH